LGIILQSPAGIVDYLPLGQNREWDTPFPKGVKFPDGLSAHPLVYVDTPGYMRAMGTGIPSIGLPPASSPTTPAWRQRGGPVTRQRVQRVEGNELSADADA